MARRALDDAPLALSAARGAVSLELRDGLDGDGFRIREGLYYRFRRPLHATDEENFAAIPRKQRRMIRVGQRCGLVCAQRVVRRARLPRSVRPQRRRLGDAGVLARLLSPPAGDLPRPVCDPDRLLPRRGRSRRVLSFLFRDTVMPYYAGSRREYFRQAANDVMYWELMRYAAVAACATSTSAAARSGRAPSSSSGTGVSRPSRCATACTPEAIEHCRRARSTTPAVRLLRWGWRRLPLGFTKLLGPPLVRRFGSLYT